jgi:hypothetical protein
MGLSILAVAALLPAFIDHYQFSTSKFAVGLDASQQLPPLIAWLEDDFVLDEYIRRYYLSWMPPLTKGYYWLMSALGVSVINASVALQYGSFIFLAVFGWLIGARLCGIPCAFGTVLILISTGFFYNIIGGIPRSFAFLMFAAILWGVVSQRFIATCMFTVVSSTCYPIATVVGGITLVVWLSVKTLKSDLRSDRIVQLRWVALCIAGVVSVALLLSISHGIENEFGSAIEESEYGIYPEAGPDGRSWTRRKFDNAPHFDRLRKVISSALVAPNRFIDFPKSDVVFLLLLLTPIAFFYTIKHSTEARPIIYFVVAATLAYILAELADPYLYFSHRYAYYSLPLVFAVTLPYALYHVSRTSFSPGRVERAFAWKQSSLFVALMAIVLGVTGGPPPPGSGYHYLDSDDRRLLEYVATLPETSKVALWPKSNLAASVPLAARRSVLFNDKFHQSFHRDYVLEMRIRASDFFAAYFYPTASNLIRLRDQHQVSHMIIDQRHFSGTSQVKYFEPFNGQIVELRERMKTHPSGIDPEELGYQLGRYRVVPLAQFTSVQY